MNIKEYYRDVFGVNYSLKNNSLYQIELICKNKKKTVENSCLVPDGLLSKSHFMLNRVTNLLDELKRKSLLGRITNRFEIIAAFQSTLEVASAGYVFENKLIRLIAENSLTFGITLFKPDTNLSASMQKRRNTVVNSRKNFNWYGKKLVSSNINKKGNLVKISLDFCDRKLIPSRITKLIGIEPDISCVKGEVVFPKANRKAYQGVWTILANDQSMSLNSSLVYFLNYLSKYYKNIRKVAKRPIITKCIEISVFGEFDKNGLLHFRFSPEFFKTMYLLGLDFALTIIYGNR